MCDSGDRRRIIDRSPLEVIKTYQDSEVSEAHSLIMLRYCNLHSRMEWAVKEIEDNR